MCWRSCISSEHSRTSLKQVGAYRYHCGDPPTPPVCSKSSFFWQSYIAQQECFAKVHPPQIAVNRLFYYVASSSRISSTNRFKPTSTSPHIQPSEKSERKQSRSEHSLLADSTSIPSTQDSPENIPRELKRLMSHNKPWKFELASTMSRTRTSRARTLRQRIYIR